MSEAVILFAGTSEGRILAEKCAGQPIELYVSVVTDYGGELISPAENVHVLPGRKDAGAIRALIAETGAKTVIDATHPYADHVTGTLQAVCAGTGTEYLRLLRAEEHAGTEKCVFVEDTAAAVDYLSGTEGNVLLTVGSKELPAYTRLPDFENRLYARILPLPDGVAQSAALGYRGKHLICMQGPFSEELNAAMLRALDCRYLVTKDTGAAGGFPEKVRAAAACGVTVVVVARPLREEGVSLEDCLALLRARYGFSVKKQVTILGVGAGSAGSMTLDADRACREAGLIVGAKRLTEALARYGKPVKNAVAPGEIAAAVRGGPEEKVVVAMSGDTGFYSGTKKLLPLLADLRPTVLPGISSVAYLCARTGESWDDALLISAHGRECNYLAKIRHNEKVIALTGGDSPVSALLEALCANGLGGVSVTVGSDLSYETESVTTGTAEELRGRAFPPLAVLLVKNPEAAAAVVTHGREDGDFLRAEVPMTKQEIRAVTLSKLALTRSAVCWDVGAGTGSVSLEMAEQCADGVVYAVEHKAEACGLIEQNKLHLGVANVEVVRGAAPEALSDLPAPDRVFIGGSSGSLGAILDCALAKNPAARIVLNTVTAESFAEAVQCLKERPVTDPDIVLLNAARGRKAGRYHLMTAQNPVYVISCTGAGN